MTNRYLLDTNIAIAGLKNEASIRRHLKGVTSYVSVITAGELLHGALKSNQRAQNLSTTRSYLSTMPVLVCDMTTAERYSLIRYQLEQQGERIPENDIWIAAHAAQYDLTLVTRDAHFGRVLGIRLEA